ncbi:MAG: cation transporter [Clostridia bacterium]|nr:cation transporter [Clostridia bacterium]
MKTDKKIFIAFLLNLSFSIIEFIGGIITGSIAIFSDSVHDFGDSLSIGLSYLLERISKRKPDKLYTYGYKRYSVLGSVITTVILLFGSLVVIFGAVPRMIKPVAVDYDGMIIFSVFGVIVNFFAAYFTHGKGSLNQKAVNLHMLEDVLGWLIVLIGSIIMRYTDIKIIDPVLSIVVALFILVSAIKNLKETVDIFLEKSPFDVEEIREHLMEIEGVKDIHHIHIRTIDGVANCATLHAVTDCNAKTIKDLIKSEMAGVGISHTTVEIEGADEVCEDTVCKTEEHHHHHHHHH